MSICIPGAVDAGHSDWDRVGCAVKWCTESMAAHAAGGEEKQSNGAARERGSVSMLERGRVVCDGMRRAAQTRC
eukprot:868747-Rhodomonas_salina.1